MALLAHIHDYTFNDLCGDVLYRCSVCSDYLCPPVQHMIPESKKYCEQLSECYCDPEVDVVVDDKIYLCCDYSCKAMLELTGIFDQPYYTLRYAD